ncbi:MAG: methionine adenosyltransferase domain-containing protein [Acholeplasmataceae bacterium]
MKRFLYSNETVFRGHPDKVCDQISDAILDACLTSDPYSRCGIEVAGGKSTIFVTGEVTTSARIDTQTIADIVQRVLNDVGYTDKQYAVFNDLGVQSPDIALGTNDRVGGSGDNGMMFGYACNDTPRHLPTAMVILQELAQMYDDARKGNPQLLPDGKAQITGVYDEHFKLVGIDTFTVCYQNRELSRNVTDHIIMNMLQYLIEEYRIPTPRRVLINPTGRFRIGGFEGDAGLTGRKIVVDNYQSFSRVGGGAFSGKDPSKMDRSGAYKAREIAIEYLQAYDLRWCEVQLSYSIGIESPMAIYIQSDQGPLEPRAGLYEECTPRCIIRDLHLLAPTYEQRAQFGHFR